MKRRFVMVLALCCVLAAGLSVWPPAQAADQSGSCGPNLTWTINRKTLTISGTGDMDEYAGTNGTYYTNRGEWIYSGTTAPWWDLRGDFRTVVIENGVTSVSDYAFCKCDNITSLTIGVNVDTIGYYAFTGCSAIRELTIPDSVTKIFDYAFQDCSGLEIITLSNNLKTISKNLFDRCPLISTVQIPKSVTEIGYAAFGSNSSLKNVVILGDLSNIDAYAFGWCSRLQNFTCKGLDTLGDNAFTECGRLSDVFFSGSQADWDDLYFGDGNDALKNAKIHPNFKAEATLITLDKDSLELQPGKAATLTAALYPASAASEELRWSSSDNAVAEIKDGQILAKKAGTATITATTLDGRLTAACNVAVTSPVPEGQFTVNSLSVKNDDGALDAVPTGSFMASVSVTNTTASDAPYVMLAAYGTGSQFVSLLYVKVDATPGGTVEVMLPVDNSGGEITQLKAFAVSGDGSMIPAGPSVSFPAQ